ncbi:hypothetical protein EVA_08931 [gut metagenome]|uniref:Uncharacterized protein n=1 Tax=gut metagenome TaxID=749906 RepID=J9G7W4_9ZZZZ
MSRSFALTSNLTNDFEKLVDPTLLKYPYEKSDIYLV